MARLGILDANGDPRYSGWQTGPLTPDPDPPGEFTHGDQVFRWNVGRPDGFYPEDTRTPLSAPTDVGFTVYTSGDSDSVIENVRFTSNVRVEQGCDNIRFRYCIFDPPANESGGQYAFRNHNGGGRVYLDDCTFVGKYGKGKTILLQGSGGIWMKRCLALGSEDVIHVGGASGAQPWPTYGCDDFVGARFIAEDCFIGDGVRLSGGHVDCFQWDNNGGNAIFKRCKMLSYSMVYPEVPRAVEGDPLLPGNGSVLLTYGASPIQLQNFSWEDCRFDGGNFGLNLSPPDGPAPLIAAVRRCHFGAEAPVTFEGDQYVSVFRYGAVRGGTHKSDNTWAATGDVLYLGGGGTPTIVGVTEGQPI